jgi:hypothetical protein
MGLSKQVNFNYLNLFNFNKFIKNQNFRMNFKKAEVKCEICGDKSHPTGDCP